METDTITPIKRYIGVSPKSHQLSQPFIATCEKHSSNTVQLTLSGNLPAGPLDKVLKQVDEMGADIQQSGHRKLLLVDSSGLEVIQMDARKHGVSWLKNTEFEKISVFGSSTFIKYFVKMLHGITGSNIAYFTSKEEAQSWLDEMEDIA